MLNNPKISVIIPFYSNKSYLKEALESVAKQTYQNYEILLINDGSSESISDIVEQYHGKLIYIEQTNKGAAAARNVGIEFADGQYLAFLDADDLWEPDKLEKQIRFMLDFGYKWSHTAYYRFRTENNLTERHMADFSGNIFPKCLATNPIATPCVMIAADVLKNGNLLRFKEGMKSGEDSFLWMLLAMRYKIGYLDDCLTRVRIRGKNSSQLAWHQLRARSEMWTWIDWMEMEKTLDVNVIIDLPIRFAYRVCSIEYELITRFFSDCSRDSWGFELLSKFFYSFPWIIFKIHNFRVCQRKHG